MSLRGEIFLIRLGLFYAIEFGPKAKMYQMKVEDLVFNKSKSYQKNLIYYHRNGDEKCFTTYLCTKVGL